MTRFGCVEVHVLQLIWRLPKRSPLYFASGTCAHVVRAAQREVEVSFANGTSRLLAGGRTCESRLGQAFSLRLVHLLNSRYLKGCWIG